MTRMLQTDSFSFDYFEARQKFVSLCEGLECEILSYILSVKGPAKGPENRELTMDVARFGSDDAKNLLVALSGTHGIEGLCGSGCQVDWLRSGAADSLPEDLAVVLIHFVNPFGGAWAAIENESNVDLNRNFLNHDELHPANLLYEELHEAFVCPQLEGPLRDSAEELIREFIEKRGFDAFLEAAARGQYTHPGGFNFGGTEPAWSNRTVRQVLANQRRQARRIAMIDYHTGLGPYGNGMIIFDGGRENPAGKRVLKWFGKDVAFNDGGEIGYIPMGGLVEGCASEFREQEFTGIVLEYGTWEIGRIADAMRNSFWLQHYGDRFSPLGKRVRQELQDAFYVDADDWKRMVLRRSRQVIEQTVSGLVSS